MSGTVLVVYYVRIHVNYSPSADVTIQNWINMMNEMIVQTVVLILLFFLLQSHTILMVQPNTRPDTRTYSDYESLNECLEGK